MESIDPTTLIPHRDPFLLVSAITELVPGESARGYWELTGEETFFAGHFPDRPTLPGVLMLESIAQLGAAAILASDEHKGKLPLFGGVDGVRFRRQVSPGEKLELEITLTRMSSRGGKGEGRAHVGGETACEANLLFVLADT